MAKHKAPQDIRDRRKQLPERQEGKHTEPLLARWWKSFLTALGLLGAVAGVLTLIPRLSVDVSGSLRSHDPMGTVFALSNDGLLPVHDINVVCGIESLRDTGGNGITGIGMVLPGSHSDILSPANKMTLPCAHAVEMTLVTAKITIVVTYRPDFVWWHRTAEYPMDAERADDGTWVWKRLPH